MMYIHTRVEKKNQSLDASQIVFLAVNLDQFGGETNLYPTKCSMWVLEISKAKKQMSDSEDRQSRPMPTTLKRLYGHTAECKLV